MRSEAQHRSSPVRSRPGPRQRRALLLLPWLLALCLALPSPADRLGRAVELDRAGSKAEARQLLERIVAQEPDNHRALWNRGLVSMEQAEFKEAARWFERAIAVDDGIAIYHLWRGYAQAQRVERAAWVRKPFLAPRMREAFERAVELDGSSVDARRALMSYYERAPGLLGGSAHKAREQATAIEALSAGSGR